MLIVDLVVVVLVAVRLDENRVEELVELLRVELELVASARRGEVVELVDAQPVAVAVELLERALQLAEVQVRGREERGRRRTDRRVGRVRTVIPDLARLRGRGRARRAQTARRRRWW